MNKHTPQEEFLTRFVTTQMFVSLLEDKLDIHTTSMMVGRETAENEMFY